MGESYWLYPGDCGAVLRAWPGSCLDALVTDPPAGIGFMAKAWDSDKGGRDQWIMWLAGVMGEALRVLKPGAHGLVWAIPRTSHWTALALELAGFEVRDRVSHFFGQGFPKSRTEATGLPPGQGTALKPACEDWWLVRKPCDQGVTTNIAEWGTGGLNIGACRLGPGGGPPRPVLERAPGATSLAPTPGPRGGDARGRWPANVAFDEEAAAALDAQTPKLARGGRLSGAEPGSRAGQVALGALGARGEWEPYGDAGGASRFFYCSKASKRERELGCEALPPKTGGEATGRKDGSKGVQNPRAGAGRGGGRRNYHPTVKPLDLMGWLCRLITPIEGVILDPFMGSGSTGVAALTEGFRFVGIEADEAYMPIAQARLARASAERRAA